MISGSATRVVHRHFYLAVFACMCAWMLTGCNGLWEFFCCGDARHDSAINAGEFDGGGDFGYADQSFLDGVDGQRGCGWIQGGAMLGSRLREFCADCNTDWCGIR